MKTTFDKTSPAGIQVSTGYWAHQTPDDPEGVTLHCWVQKTRRDGWVAFHGPGVRYRRWTRKAAVARFFEVERQKLDARLAELKRTTITPGCLAP